MNIPTRIFGKCFFADICKAQQGWSLEIAWRCGGARQTFCCGISGEWWCHPKGCGIGRRHSRWCIVCFIKKKGCLCRQPFLFHSTFLLGTFRFVFFRWITPLRMIHFLFWYGFSSVMPYVHNRAFDTPKSCGVNWSKMADIEPKYRCNAPSKHTWYIVLPFIRFVFWVCPKHQKLKFERIEVWDKFPKTPFPIHLCQSHSFQCVFQHHANYQPKMNTILRMIKIHAGTRCIKVYIIRFKSKATTTWTPGELKSAIIMQGLHDCIKQDRFVMLHCIYITMSKRTTKMATYMAIMVASGPMLLYHVFIFYFWLHQLSFPFHQPTMSLFCRDTWKSWKLCFLMNCGVVPFWNPQCLFRSQSGKSWIYHRPLNRLFPKVVWANGKLFCRNLINLINDCWLMPIPNCKYNGITNLDIFQIVSHITSH